MRDHSFPVMFVLMCLVLGLIGLYICDLVITVAMPQILMPQLDNEQAKIDYCSKLSGDGDAISWAMGHECVYNCTMYYPDRCLDHGWHYERGATSIWVIRKT
jgi:hypothetical protein